MPRVMLTYQTGSAFNRSCFIQPPPTPPLPAEPYASAFALAYSLRLRSCRLMGAFVIWPLPPFLSEELQAAGSLRSTGVTPLPRYYEPHRYPLVFDRLPGGLRLYGLPCCRRFLGGTRRASPVARTRPVSPCCHFHPAGVTNRLSQVTVRHAVFASRLQARPPSVRTFGATSVFACATAR